MVINAFIQVYEPITGYKCIYTGVYEPITGYKCIYTGV